MSSLEHAVARYLRTVSASPAAAVSHDELAELQRALGKASGESFVAPAIPVADDTWQYRTVLAAAAVDTSGQELDIAREVCIVGFKTTLLLVDTTAGLIVPPLEAIDYNLITNRKREYTATLEDDVVNKPSQLQWANLPLIDNDHRLTKIKLDKNVGWTISASFRWAVPLASVAAFGWGDVQISLGMFVIWEGA